MKTKCILAVLVLGSGTWLLAAPLTESTFTEVVKEVSKVAADTKAAQPAQVNDVVKAPDLVRTGPESRAELTAPDQTITRVGANTGFSFESAGRNINLERGSLLFHSPSGKGGGTIKSGGAAAAVLGTTIIVAAMPGGGFKVIVLEGNAKVTLANGKSVKLKAGQLVFVLPGRKDFSKVLTINLVRLVNGSLLVNGFSRELASLALISAAIQKQNKDLATGRMQDTGLPADSFVAWPSPGNGLNALDANSYQTAVHPGLTPGQIFDLVGGQSNGGGGGPGGAGVVLVTGGRAR